MRIYGPHRKRKSIISWRAATEQPLIAVSVEHSMLFGTSKSIDF